MKRVATIIDYALCFAVLKCPFCEARTTVNPTMPWCGNCFVEYYRGKPDPRTGGVRWVFDDKRKTPRFAWAKALGKAGGMRLGEGK